MKRAKTFDCVEMMHRGGEKLLALTAGMTHEEELAFWMERHEELVQRQQELRQRKAAVRQQKAA